MSDLPAQRLRASYDRVAPEYARRIAGELADKPFDRELLDHFGASIDHHWPVYLTPAQLRPAVQGFREALRSGGRLLLSFHIGREVKHVDDLWGYAVDLDFVFFQPEEITDLLKAAGFLIDAVLERGPYPEVEVQTRRAYLLATRS
jgi:hypothetical protein